MPNCCSALVASSVVGSVLIDLHLNPAAAELFELAQIVQQIEPRLHVVLRHVGADIGVDLNRPALGVQIAEQAAPCRATAN